LRLAAHGSATALQPVTAVEHDRHAVITTIAKMSAHSASGTFTSPAFASKRGQRAHPHRHAA